MGQTECKRLCGDEQSKIVKTEWQKWYQEESRKNGHRKNGPRKNGPREKWSPEKWSPRKMVPGKMAPGKNGSWKIDPRKNSSRKIGPRETQKQKIVGRRSSIVVCVWNVGMWSIYENSKLENKSKTRKRTRNTKTKNRGVSVEHRGVCVECSDVINLRKPKTRQQIFLESFSVLQFGTYVGSWRKRQTFFCVCSEINW